MFSPPTDGAKGAGKNARDTTDYSENLDDLQSEP